jgi:hypothetical protein
MIDRSLAFRALHKRSNGVDRLQRDAVQTVS